MAYFQSDDFRWINFGRLVVGDTDIVSFNLLTKMACNPTKIIAALHEEKQNIRDIVRIDIKTSRRLFLRKISDGGVVEPSSNQESIVYGEGVQAPMKYRTLDNDPRALVSGQMEGRNLAGRNGIFNTNIQSIDDNACHGFCTIKFAQGYKKRGFKDYAIDVDTPILCASELSRLPRQHVEGFFDGFRRNFTKFGLDNFNDNLQNLVIQEGEANASITGPNTFEVSKGGFSAPPQYRLSIHFLERYRDHVLAEMEMLGLQYSDDWKLEVEAPKEDVFIAITEHQKRRNGMVAAGTSIPMTHYNESVLKDPRDKMNGRSFIDFGNIRFFFNERPIRGYFKPVGVVGGNLQYEFVRVFHWKNNPGEVGGLVLVPNHQYRQDTITVDGVKHEMCTLVPHVHPLSFKRYRLRSEVVMKGAERPMSVNYDVVVVDGADIAGNIHRTKFGLAARHQFRLKVDKPELSGFIAYRHGREAGYAISVTPENATPSPDNFSGPEQFRECDLIDPQTVANCAQCGEVPTSEGNCVAEGSAANGVVYLDPTGSTADPLVVDYTGGTVTARIAIRRRGELAKAGSVTYQVHALATPSAIAGTHFTAAGPTTVNFAKGQEFAFIDIAIISASGNVNSDLDFRVTLASPTNVTLGGVNSAIVRIHDVR